jgi:hypothetical protein
MGQWESNRVTLLSIGETDLVRVDLNADAESRNPVPQGTGSAVTGLGAPDSN